MTKLTSRVIAKMAGVSPAAVSFALNGKKGISEQTRKHILDIIAETNYRPAPGLRGTGNALNIAVIFKNYLATLDKLFYTELNTSFMQACESALVNLIITPVYRNGKDIILPDIFKTGVLDGIITYGDPDENISAELETLGIPVVILDSSRRGDKQTAVYVDYDFAAYTATRHLIELGHKDIAFLGNDKMHDFNLRTFSGFQRATTENGIQLGTNRIQLNVYNEQSLQLCIDNALLGTSKPTALFCATDCYAIHTIRYLHTKGLNVPGDISVIGIDDIIISEHLIPSLTTVKIDRDKMSILGMELLQKRIRSEECESITLPSCDLIVRESTAPPRKK